MTPAPGFRRPVADLVPLELMPALSDGPGPLALPSPATMLVAIVSGLLCTAAVATCAIVAFRKRQYAGYRRGDAKTLDELENQRNHEHHVHHHGHLPSLPGLPGLPGHHPGLHDQQLYSPSPARKAISSSLAGQKGSDTSDYEICPYATFSLANANQGGRQTAGGGGGGGGGVGPTGTLTPSKSLASYSLQLHTFSQRDCYAEGPLPQRRPSGQQQQIYGARSRSKAPSAASVAAAAPRLSDSEISCISSQQTLPMSLAVSQRRKATSPPHCRDRTRPRSLVGGGGGGGGCGGARYESDSSSPSDKLGQPHHGLNHHHYRARAHTPSRRSSKSQDNDSSGESAEGSPELHHRMQGHGPACRSLPRRAAAGSPSPRPRPRSRQHSTNPRHRDRDRAGGAARCRASGSGSGSDAGVGAGADADTDVVRPSNGDLDFGDGSDGHYPSRSQLLLPDAQLEQELSSLIKRYRHDRQREKQDYTIHV